MTDLDPPQTFPAAAPGPTDVDVELELLRFDHQALCEMTLRMHVLVLFGLLAAGLFTPFLGRDSAVEIAYSMVIGAGSPVEGSLLAQAGLALVTAGLSLVVVGVLLSLLGARPLSRLPLRTSGALMASWTAFALTLGALLSAAGAQLIPHGGPGLGIGVVFQLSAAVWLWHTARSLRQFTAG